MTQVCVYVGGGGGGGGKNLNAFKDIVWDTDNNRKF
jgi:hypothetical protein